MKGAFLIPNSQESAISFCDLGCYNVYTFYVDINPVMGKKLKPNPSDCMIHDDKCPDWLWYSSYPIMSDFLDVIEEETGKRDCPDIIFDTADRIAKKNQLISGTDLGLMTLDSL